MKIKPFQNMPKVRIEINAKDYANYRALVDAVAPNEVQWYSMVEKTVFQHKDLVKKTSYNSVIYRITDIVIPSQVVSPTEVDTDTGKNPESIYAIYKELTGRHINDTELGYDEVAVNSDISKLHVWCHSHPFTSDPKPSGQDTNQFKQWVIENQINQQIETPMVALIFGKTEKIHGRIYDPAYSNAFYDDVDIDIVYSPESHILSYIESAIANKIKRQPNATVVDRRNWYGNHMVAGYHASSSLNFKSKSTNSHYKNSKTKNPTVELTSSDKAQKMFSKRFKSSTDGDWCVFLENLNNTYEQSQYIAKLVDFVQEHWIKTNLELYAFSIALTVSVDSIDDYYYDSRIGDTFLDKEAHIMIQEASERLLYDSELIKSAIQFAKKTCSDISQSAFQKAINDYYTELFLQGQIQEEYFFEQEGEYTVQTFI